MAAVLAGLNYYGNAETQNETSSIARVLPSGGLYLRLNPIVAYVCVCEAFGHKIPGLQSHLCFLGAKGRFLTLEGPWVMLTGEFNP